MSRDPRFSLIQASDEDHAAAQRLSDVIRGLPSDYTVEELFAGWIAVRLSDGAWNGVLYDSRKAAVSHQSNPYFFAFVATRTAVTSAMSPEEAHIFLTYQRMATENGLALPDPDAANGGKEVIMPLPREAVGSQVRRLLLAKNVIYRPLR